MGIKRYEMPKKPWRKKRTWKESDDQTDKMSSGDGWFRKGQLDFIKMEIGSTWGDLTSNMNWLTFSYAPYRVQNGLIDTGEAWPAIAVKRAHLHCVENEHVIWRAHQQCLLLPDMLGIEKERIKYMQFLTWAAGYLVVSISEKVRLMEGNLLGPI